MNKRLILSLLIAPLLVYGGFKGYIWYKVKNGMDEAIAAVAPFVDITYGGIFSTLEGEVGIEDIVIQPKMTNDEFTVQSMSIRAESIFDFVNVGKRFRKGDFPKQASWKVQKLVLDLDSNVFSMISQYGEQAAANQPQHDAYLFERLDALGCGDVDTFGLTEIIDMGYTRMELDITLGMEYRDISHILKLILHVEDREMYRADAEIAFALDMDRIRAGAIDSGEPEVAAMNVVYTDMGYFKLRNAFCAKKINDSESAYIDANIARLNQEIGGELPKNVVKEYRNFMASGGTIEISLSPAEPVALSGMEFYEKADVMQILGMTMAINGVQFDEEQINWKASARKPVQPNENTAKYRSFSRDNKSVKNPREKLLSAKRREPKLTTVKISQLARYVGKTIQVETTNGKRRAGELESIDEERVRIKMRMGSGEFSFPIKIDEIKSAKVYR